VAWRTIHLETFGCQMNELDSQLVTGALRALGYAFADTPEAADVVLYNTCSVRDLAEQKVRSRLGEMRLRKRTEPALVVGVLGCMAERDGTSLIDKYPVVDVLCGPGELDKLPGLLDNAVRTRESMLSDDAPASTPTRSARAVALQGDASRRSSTLAAAQDTLELLDLSRAVSPTDHNGSAYVRITRGCNKFCTYCVVPHTRGAEVHRPPDHIVDECKRLADAGVIEITLLGQTVNHYRFEHGAAVAVDGILQPQKGRTYKGSHHRDALAGERVTTFADLLRRIHDEVPAIQRLRFVTSYPRDFGDDVLEVIRDAPRICRYLHVPAQSGSDAVLDRMNRGYTVAEYLEFIDRARGYLDRPDLGRPLTIAGDMIVGFCGETEADFEASKALLRRARYKNCFIFKYSPRPGTTAFGRLDDDVPDEVKRRRCNDLLAVQHEVSDAISQSQIGTTQMVFVEGPSAHEQKRLAKAAPTPQGACATNPGVSLTIGGRAAGAATLGQGVPDSGAPGPGVGRSGPVQLTGRTDGDLIVVFDCPEGRSPDSVIGGIYPVRITDSNVVTMWGEFAG
jgi:tRNA-2-methylthio-N6-dimethylallyladenosine synthase